MAEVVTGRRMSVEKNDAWQSSGGKKISFDSDDVHDAYLAGKKVGFAHGVSNVERAANNFLKEKAEKVAGFSLSILNFLKEKSLTAGEVYLRVVSWDELSVLIMVQEDSFVNPVFKQVYDIVYALEDTAQQEDFTLNFSFSPYGETLSESCLAADGYIHHLKHEFVAANQ